MKKVKPAAKMPRTRCGCRGPTIGGVGGGPCSRCLGNGSYWPEAVVFSGANNNRGSVDFASADFVSTDSHA